MSIIFGKLHDCSGCGGKHRGSSQFICDGCGMDISDDDKPSLSLRRSARGWDDSDTIHGCSVACMKKAAVEHFGDLDEGGTWEFELETEYPSLIREILGMEAP